MHQSLNAWPHLAVLLLSSCCATSDARRDPYSFEFASESSNLRGSVHWKLEGITKWADLDCHYFEGSKEMTLISIPAESMSDHVGLLEKSGFMDLGVERTVQGWFSELSPKGPRLWEVPVNRQRIQLSIEALDVTEDAVTLEITDSLVSKIAKVERGGGLLIGGFPMLTNLFAFLRLH